MKRMATSTRIDLSQHVLAELIREVLRIEREIADGLEKLLKEIEA